MRVPVGKQRRIRTIVTRKGENEREVDVKSMTPGATLSKERASLIKERDHSGACSLDRLDMGGMPPTVLSWEAM